MRGGSGKGNVWQGGQRGGGGRVLKGDIAKDARELKGRWKVVKEEEGVGVMGRRGLGGDSLGRS